MADNPLTNVDDFIGELGAGVFKETLAAFLSKCALGTVLYSKGQKKGKVTVEFTIEQLGDNEQVKISHKLGHSTPTPRGKAGEEGTTETTFFVGKGGVLTVNPPKEENSGQFQLTSDKVSHISEAK